MNSLILKYFSSGSSTWTSVSENIRVCLITTICTQRLIFEGSHQHLWREAGGQASTAEILTFSPNLGEQAEQPHSTVCIISESPLQPCCWAPFHPLCPWVFMSTLVAIETPCEIFCFLILPVSYNIPWLVCMNIILVALCNPTASSTTLSPWEFDRALQCHLECPTGFPCKSSRSGPTAKLLFTLITARKGEGMVGSICCRQQQERIHVQCLKSTYNAWVLIIWT